MKFRKLNTYKRLNEGRGKFEMERFDGGDEGEYLVSTLLEWKDSAGSHYGYDTEVYIAVIVDPNDTDLNLYFGQNVYCEIKGYDWAARNLVDKALEKIFKMKNAKDVIAYIKSL